MKSFSESKYVRLWSMISCLLFALSVHPLNGSDFALYYTDIGVCLYVPWIDIVLVKKHEATKETVQVCLLMALKHTYTHKIVYSLYIIFIVFYIKHFT